MKNITVAYVRVSTERQLDGNGPEQQRAAICAWAAANGIQANELDWVHEDESGTIEDREQIQALLTRARAGQIGTLIFDRMDRLGRTLSVCENLFNAFTAAKVNIVCVSTVIDTSPVGTLVRQMMGAIAEYQRAEWLGRMRTCRRSTTSKKGLFHGGGVPYGYRSVGKGVLEIDEATARVVRKTFLMRDTMKYSYNQISNALAREGILTSAGKKLDPKQIHTIIARRDFYAGRQPLHDIDLADGVKMQHPPIISGDHAMHGTAAEAALETGN